MRGVWIPATTLWWRLVELIISSRRRACTFLMESSHASMDKWIGGLTASPSSLSILAISVITCLLYQQIQHIGLVVNFNEIKAKFTCNEIWRLTYFISVILIFRYTTQSEINAYYFLFQAVEILDMWKSYRTSLQHCWRHSYFIV